MLLSATVESLYALFDLCPGRQQKHRRVDLAPAQLAQNLQAVFLGHHDVEHDAVIFARQGVIESVPSVPDTVCREFTALKYMQQRLDMCLLCSLDNAASKFM